MEISVPAIKQRLDAADVLYTSKAIQHGYQLEIVDSRGLLPDNTLITLYDSGTILIRPATLTLRQLLNSIHK